MDMRDSIRPNGQRPWPPKSNQQPPGGPHEGQVGANPLTIYLFYFIYFIFSSTLHKIYQTKNIELNASSN